MQIRLRYVFTSLGLTCASTACNVFCHDGTYGNPLAADCLKALSRFPQDETLHFFLDQEMRSSPQQLDWQYILDPRPLTELTPTIQLPLRISEGILLSFLKGSFLILTFAGTCNVAIFGYAHDSIRISRTFLSWSGVSECDTVLHTACLSVNMGGAAVVKGTL